VSEKEEKNCSVCWAHCTYNEELTKKKKKKEEKKEEEKKA